MFIELQVPPDSSNLNEYIEDHFNTSSRVGRFCESGCQRFGQAEKRSTMTLAEETNFIIVVLTRAMEILDGFQLNSDKVTATKDVFIR